MPLSSDDFELVSCSDIPAAAVAWLWEPYLPRGKLAVLDGDPGAGKSVVALDLAARVSAGRPLPGAATAAAPADVLLLNAEDDARDTIRPRVVAAGGDPARVRVAYAPGVGGACPRLPDDGPRLARAVRGCGAALVVIDPLTAFLAPACTGDAAVRQALAPLAEVAAETGACILLVRHLRKAGGVGAVYRGAGTVGIVGAVRTGLALAPHPDDAELRVLAVTKANVGPPGRSLGLRLCGSTGGPVVEWCGPLDVSADDLFGSGVSARGRARTRERAAEWLREFLAGGARRAAEVDAAARAAGIADRTLRRAKAACGVVSEAKVTDGTTEWWWRDPSAGRAERAAAEAEIRSAAALLGRRRR